MDSSHLRDRLLNSVRSTSKIKMFDNRIQITKRLNKRIGLSLNKVELSEKQIERLEEEAEEKAYKLTKKRI